MPQELRFETWSIMRGISGTITKMMALKCSQTKVESAWSLLKSHTFTSSGWSKHKNISPWQICFDCLPLNILQLLSVLQWTSHVSMRLITCEWQLYPQGSIRTTLIDLSTVTHFLVAKTGTNQVWKVLHPPPYQITRRTFLKVYETPP